MSKKTNRSNGRKRDEAEKTKKFLLEVMKKMLPYPVFSALSSLDYQIAALNRVVQPSGLFKHALLEHLLLTTLASDRLLRVSQCPPSIKNLSASYAYLAPGELPTILSVAPVSEHPVPGILKRLEHEYVLRAELDSDWAARPLTLARREGRPLLILEDPGGEPLDRLLGEPMELSRFLRFAVGLAAALGKLHQQGLIHKDIKPANILVNSATGAIRLTGFGIASRLPRERQSPEPPKVIAGTLAYMAPEQTDRMNRSIDSRSDLYSLDVTLPEMT
jgi:serine/threonine protein kinase